MTDVTNKGIVVGANTNPSAGAPTHKLGNQLDIVAAAKDASKTYDTSNLTTDVAQDATTGKTTVTVSMKKDANFDSVTAGTGTDKTVLNKDGLTVTEGSKVTTIGEGNVQVSNGTNTLALDATKGTLEGLSNTNLSASDFATQGRAATEEQLKIVNDAQQATDEFAVKYDKDPADPTKPDLNNVTFAGTTATPAVVDPATGKMDMQGGTSLHNVASAGDYTDVNNAYNAVNAGDLNNAVTDVTNKGIKFGDGTTANQYKLGDTLNVKGSADGSITSTTVAGGVQLGLGNKITVGSGAGNKPVTIDGTAGTIGGLTAGDVSSSSTDAINGSQLNAQGEGVKNIIGGATSYDPSTGVLTNSNIGGTGESTIDDAIKNVSTAANKAKTTVSEGDNITVTSSTNPDGSTNYTVATAKNVKFDSIQVADTIINDSGVSIGQVVQLGGTGLVIQNGPSVTTAGISAGNKVITNVAAGQKDSDAVNKGQLDNAITNINNKVDQVNNNAVQYDKNADGTVNKDKVTLGGDKGTTLTNVADGKVTQGSKDAVNGGQLADIRDNLQGQITNNTNDINNIKNEINNGSLGIVKQSDPKGEITVGKETGGTTVNMAGKDGDRVVTGVKDGAINATSKDAINGSQLHAQKVETNQKVVEYLGGGAAIDNITGSFTKAPSYTVGDSKYNNVGGAIDALNKADQALGNKIDNVSNRLEQAFYSTNQRIDDVEKRANAGIAAAMSLENAPYIPGKYTYAAGAAYHGGESAIGVTLRKTADNGRWSLTGGIAVASEGDPSVRIGISGVID